jgi:hypothetical protein
MNTITREAYEGDIVSRLRNWRGLHLTHNGRLYEEAADEIERLRLALARIADQDATFAVVGGNIIVDVEATLTDAERDAIEFAIRKSTRLRDGGKTGATLRALLERL